MHREYYLISYGRQKERLFSGFSRSCANLSARQQVVAEENTQSTSHFEVVVPSENPVEFLRHVLEDVILILRGKINRETPM